MKVAVSLRPAAQNPEQYDTLTAFVDCVYQERGHLRGLTQESLRAEIDAQDDAGDSQEDSIDEAQTSEDEGDSEARLKTLWAAKQNMVNLIGEANNEVLMLRDLMSLLASKSSTLAAAGMSPAIKEMAPAGTLDYDMNPVESKDDAELRQARHQADGLTTSSLNASADQLLGAATRLENEIAKETRYWDQVLSVSERGWNMTKTRGSLHGLSIRYSCSEAGSRYRSAGQVSLRLNENGNLNIDPASAAAPKCVRVRIAEGREVLETSSLPPLLEGDDIDIDAAISQARDSLYDEELFQLLIDEARDLLPYGVKTKDGHISIPLADRDETKGSQQKEVRREVLIDLLERDTPSPSSGSLAESTALSLRLGLSHIYRERYDRRTKLPQPLSAKIGSANRTDLLKSMLGLIAHEHETSLVNETLCHLRTTLTSADISCSIVVDRGLSFISSNEAKAPTNVKSEPRFAKKTLFDSLTGAQSTTHTFKLFESIQISIITTTDLSEPHFGSYWSIVSDVSPPGHGVSDTTFKDLNALFDGVERKIRDTLLRYIDNESAQWTVKDDRNYFVSGTDPERELRVQLLNGKLAVTLSNEDMAGSPDILAVWEGTESRATDGSMGVRLLDVVAKAGVD